MTVPERILVVDDDADEVTAIVHALTAAGYQVESRSDALAGLIAVEEAQPAVVVLDWGLPFIHGPTFLTVLRTGLPGPPPVVALVGGGDDPAAVRKAGACAVLSQPPDTGALLRLVGTLLGGQSKPAGGGQP